MNNFMFQKLMSVKKKEEEIKHNEEIRKALEAIGFSDGGDSVE